MIVGRKARAGDKGFDTALLAAVARYFFTVAQFVFIHPRQRIMAPLARVAVGPDMAHAAKRDAGAAAGADDNRKDRLRALRRAIDRLRHGKAVSIVGKPHLTRKPRAEVFIQRLTVQPRGVGVFNDARIRRERARNADADSAALAGLFFGKLHETGYRLDGLRVVVTRRRHAVAKALLAVIAKRNHFGFGAA